MQLSDSSDSAISDARWGARSGSFGRDEKKPFYSYFREPRAPLFWGEIGIGRERISGKKETRRRNIPFRDQIRRQRYGVRLPVFVLIRNLLNRGQVRTSYFTSEQRSGCCFKRRAILQPLPSNSQGTSPGYEKYRSCPESGLLIEVGIFPPSNVAFLSSPWTKLAEIWYTFNLTLGHKSPKNFKKSVHRRTR